MKKLADDIDGRFVDYSTENTIITVPVDRNRTQSVTGYLIDRNNLRVVEFMSKVCEVDSTQVDARAMLELNQELFYGKVVIHEGFLKIAATALFDHSTEDQIRDMILEVARVADELEHKLVGSDVF